MLLTPPGLRRQGGPLGSSSAPAQLKTLHHGVLTLGADDPLYEPWYADNNPTNGKGFEDAVAYSVAAELGLKNPASTGCG